MGRGVVGEELRLVWLVVRYASRKFRGWLYVLPTFRWRFSRRVADRLLFAPQDLRASDSTRADEIMSGRFAFAGKLVDLRETSPFAVAPPSEAWNDGLLGFSWLRHMRAANASGWTAARLLVNDFLKSPVRSSRPALAEATMARRVLSWLSQSPMVLEDADRGFYRAFMRSITWQARYLMAAGPVGPDGLARLLAAIATMQASLCLADQDRLRRRAALWLANELTRQILPDGGHVSRNPQATMELLLDLLPLRHSFSARNIPALPELITAIDRLMPMVRFYRHADGNFATFNGMGYTQTHLVATLLAYDETMGRPVQNAPHAGYQRLEVGPSVVIVDTGPSPPVGMSQEAHAGTLSFEFSTGNCRVVTNCGAPAQGRETWRQLARTTAAHSTAIAGDASSAVFVPIRGLKRLLGGPIIAGPRKISVEREQSEDGIILAASHDGYRRGFGLIHRRELMLLAADGALIGRDVFLGPGDTPFRGTATIALRFHLHPSVAVDADESGTSVILTLATGQRWTFHAGGTPLNVEESIHFANAEGPRRSSQIVLTLPQGYAGAMTEISWSFEPDRSSSGDLS